MVILHRGLHRLTFCLCKLWLTNVNEKWRTVNSPPFPNYFSFTAMSISILDLGFLFDMSCSIALTPHLKNKNFFFRTVITPVIVSLPW